MYWDNVRESAKSRLVSVLVVSAAAVVAMLPTVLAVIYVRFRMCRERFREV